MFTEAVCFLHLHPAKICWESEVSDLHMSRSGQGRSLWLQLRILTSLWRKSKLHSSSTPSQLQRCRPCWGVDLLYGQAF